jgi:general secretion pathway protein K
MQGQTGDVDSADSPWALPLPPTPVPAGTIAATMSDLNGRFNLNNLDPVCPTARDWQTKFERLLRVLKLDPKLAGDVTAWMGDTSASTRAASDGFYLGQTVPYRAARRGFAHVSELRLVRGVDGDVFAALAPYVAALPACTKINVNTASVPVLMTLNDTMTAEMAQAIWQQGHARFQQVRPDIGNLEPQLGPIAHSDFYDVHSAYFLARGEIVLDGVPFEYASLIERRQGDPNGSANGVRTLQRSRGSD